MGGGSGRVRRAGGGVIRAKRVLERAGHVIPVFPSYGVLLLCQRRTELKTNEEK